jgi:hypothetical protein
MDDQLVQNIYKQKNLPMEIIYIILVYLREPQDAKLLEDILHFSKTISDITNKYFEKWIIIRQSEKDEDINWLENDIILYANENVSTGVSLKPKFKEIINRLCTVKNVRNRMNIFYNYAFSNKISPKTKVNILWGLFRPEERDEFIGINMDI